MPLSNVALVLLTGWAVLIFSDALSASTDTQHQTPASATSITKAAEATSREINIWDRSAAWVWSKQREFHRALTREFRALRGNERVGWALVLMSFLYGVFHAAGPGHGKAVLTTYLLTQGNRRSRAIVMGASAALLQGLTALLLVYGLVRLVGWVPTETEQASLWATRTSFALLSIVGVYLLIRALTGMRNVLSQKSSDARHGHSDHHNHSTSGECGCSHIPTVNEVNRAESRAAVMGTVLAIGLRPCSGAVLVLILAIVSDLMWHGAFAVLAMSLGTALTIVLLAIFASTAREWASAITSHRSRFWSLTAGGVEALGGVVLLFLGLWFLKGSFGVIPAIGF